MRRFQSALTWCIVLAAAPTAAWGQFQLTVSTPGGTGSCMNNLSVFNSFGWNNTVIRQSNFNASGPAFVRYFWDTNPANRVFNGSEPFWQMDSLDTAPSTSGPNMYLHLQAYNDNDNNPNNGGTSLYPGANANVTFGPYNMDVTNPVVASVAITPSPCVDTPATVTLQANVSDPNCAVVTRQDICLLGPNLALNPGFSANGPACSPGCPSCKVAPTNWTGSGTLPMIKCNDYPNPGSQDGDGHWVGVSAYEFPGVVHTSNLSQTVFLTPGRRYVLSAWASTSSSPNPCKSQLLYRDGAGPEILLDQYLTNTAGWQQLSNTVVPTSNNITMILRLQFESSDRSGSGGGQGGGGNFDNATIRECTNPDTYPAVSPAESANATWNSVTFNNPTSPVSISATDSLGNTVILDANISLNPRIPTGITPNPTICAGSSTNLTATVGTGGDQIQWLTGSCSGTVVFTGASGSTYNTGALFATTTYYVRSRTSATGCTSPCGQVTVTVTPTPTAPASAGVDRNNFCSNSGGNIVLTASGGSGTTLRWYSGACPGTSVGTGSPLTIPAPTSTTSYFARWETSTCGNSTCASVTVTVNPAPVAPAQASSNRDNICSNDGGTITLAASGGSGTTLRWFTGSCGGTSIGTGSSLNVAAPTSTTTYYARWETAACGNSSCAQVTVTVNPAPVAPTQALVDRNSFCTGDIGNISLTASGGSGNTLRWMTGSCGGTSIGTGSPLSIASPTSSTVYFARWENGCGNSGCAQIAVNVTGNAAPTAACKNISKDLQAPSGTVVVNAIEVDNNSSANASCGQSITLREIARGNVSCLGGGFGPSVTFTCSDVGPQTVTLRVTQTDGQQSCCTAIVTVNAAGACGCPAPTARCVASLTRSIQAGGSVTIQASEVNNGSTAGNFCSLTSVQVAKDGVNFGPSVTFDCSELGNRTITLKVTQNDGQFAMCTTPTTINDAGQRCTCNAPTASCKGVFTLNLVSNGQNGGTATLYPADIDNGSAPGGAACTITTREISRDGINFFPELKFDCFDLGTRVITLRITQSDAQRAICTSIVTIADPQNICGFLCAPPNALCKDITVGLTGQDLFIPAGNINGGSTPGGGPGNCHITLVEARRVLPSGGELGATFRVICGDVNRLMQAALRVTQDNGLASECLATVVVNDITDPLLFCPSDRTVPPSPGSCQASNVDLGNATTGDNCAVASVVNDAPAFFGAGTTTVKWTVTDTAGHTATCTQRVTIEDTVPPLITCPGPVAVNVDTSPPGSCVATNVNLGTPTVQDNCPGVQTTNDKPPGGFPLGTTTVTWKATDAFGNSSTCKQDVTVNDPNHTCIGVCTDPIARCKPGFTKILNGNSTTVTLAEVNNDSTPGTFGGCTISNMAIKNSVGGFYASTVAFNCTEVGQRSVTLKVTQSDGKTAECTTPVTIVDNTPPQAFFCPSDREPNPDPGGCTASNVNLGTPIFGDSCGVSEPVNDAPAVFPAGTTTVTWTGSDPSGNTVTCKQKVTVAGTQPNITGNTTLTVQSGSTCPNPANQMALTATDSSPASLTWTVKTQGAKGVVSFTGGNTGGSVAVCYQPNGGASGSDSFTVETTNSCGGKDDHAVTVTIQGGGTAPTLSSAVSRRKHGSGSSFDIPLPLSGTAAIEPRDNGSLPQIVLTFSGSIEAADGTANCGQEVIVTNGTCNAVSISGSTMTVDVSFTKNKCVKVTLSGLRGAGGGPAMTGDADVEVVAHLGNVNGVSGVNILDLQAIKNQLNQPLSESNFRLDVTVNNSINILDLQATKNNLNQAASCP